MMLSGLYLSVAVLCCLSVKISVTAWQSDVNHTDRQINKQTDTHRQTTCLALHWGID